MSEGTLYDKVFDAHVVGGLPTGQLQVFIGLHLIHDVTISPAFGMLREAGMRVAFPERTFATADHMVPTHSLLRPFSDQQAETLVSELERNVRQYGITFFAPGSDRHGIVHIIGPELGLTQPGMTIACGDSHTSTHGAFGAIALGVGTTEIRYLLETQTLPLDRLKVRRINVDGELQRGVYAKDVILEIIRMLGVGGGKGFAYEYGGAVVDRMTMEGRMTLCNMSIEGGALVGYVNPDDTTFAYIKGREYAPKGTAFDRAVAFWRSVASDPKAKYDHTVNLDGGKLEPMVTWGTNPGQAVGVTQRLPRLEDLPESERGTAGQAYEHMRLTPGGYLVGTPVNVAFIGSCTNGRISDLREAASILEGRHVAEGVRALVVPGSQSIKYQAEQEGLDRIFTEAGAEWRNDGCSMCLGMNPDRLIGDELCASSSNRNFVGRQGSPLGRTILMSPAMVAAAAAAGRVVDVREYAR
ncbi:3-isopropylmalate dehydratase large subunit [Candidatus Woesearchaeota archaeon]|nr:3-isopropylmalate dehydratase large subunit [Candidatus Woesearchaeota archaeon]